MRQYKSPRSSSQFKISMNPSIMQTRPSAKMQISSFKRDLSRQETEECLPVLDNSSQVKIRSNGNHQIQGAKLAQSVFISSGRKDTTKMAPQLGSQPIMNQNRMTSSQMFQSPKKQFKVYNLTGPGSTGTISIQSHSMKQASKTPAKVNVNIQQQLTNDALPGVTKFTVNNFAKRTIGPLRESLDDSQHLQGLPERGQSLARGPAPLNHRPSVVKVQVQSPKPQVPLFEPRGETAAKDVADELESSFEMRKKQSYLLNVNGIEYKVPLLDPIETSSLILKRRHNQTPKSTKSAYSNANLQTSESVLEIGLSPRGGVNGDTMVSKYFKSNQAKEFLIKRKALGKV